MAYMDLLGIRLEAAGPERVEASMPVTPELCQPFGYLHGGATISLLETVASVGAQERADLATQRPFGVEVHVRHRKAARAGTVRGVAALESEEPSRSGALKQFWKVAAFDEQGDVVSDGVVVTKIVDLDHLARRQAGR